MPGDREGVKQLPSCMHSAFPDFKSTVDDIVAEAGDKVVSARTWRGTHQGEFMGIPPTGRLVVVLGVIDIESALLSGKVVEHWGQMDNHEPDAATWRNPRASTKRKLGIQQKCKRNGQVSERANGMNPKRSARGSHERPIGSKQENRTRVA